MMRFRQPRAFNAGVALVAGVVIGLAVGLLIGWVIWPVEWQGAAVNELFPEAKAEYLAAVAEGYAMYSSPEAAERARRRVAGFGDQLGSELEAAIGHFSASDDPEKSLRISNLTSLAAALGVTLPNLVGVTGAEGDAPAPVEEAAATPVDTVASPENAAAEQATAPDDAGIGWGGWLLGTLIALGLILGGLYLLLQLARRNNATADEPMGQIIDREISALQPAENAARDQPRLGASGPQPGANRELEDDEFDLPPIRPAATHQPNAEPDEYRFDDDPDDYTSFRAGTPGAAANRAGHYTSFPLDSNRSGLRRPEPAVTPIDPEEEEDEDDLWEEDDETPTTTGIQPGPGFNSGSTPAATGVGFDQNHRSGVSNANAAPGRANSLPRPMTYSRGAARSKLLEVYTAHYHAGIQDYDEAHPITDTHSGKYIGECGMGVSNKHGTLPNNPNQVVALEVWLFDKTDDKNLGNQTRVLLSEYAIDHNLDQAFLRERQDDPRPFTAQPNVQFQVEGQNLLLDCTILEAVYTPSGPNKGVFQSVKVEMAVHRKS
jgi:hypothetical protein